MTARPCAGENRIKGFFGASPIAMSAAVAKSARLKRNRRRRWNSVSRQRYPGQYFDAESGLHYNYLRDYDPTTGRYIESDPIGLRGGFNTYAYVSGSSLRFVDRFGLTAEDVARTWDQVQRAFPDLAPRGKVSCDPSVPDGRFGTTAEFSGNISVNQKYCDKKCLTREEWEELFLTLFHEGMHSSDPWYQGFFDDESFEAPIYAREQFEYNRGSRLRSPPPSEPMWGTPSPEPADFGALYDQFERGGNQCCGGQ